MTKPTLAERLRQMTLAIDFEIEDARRVYNATLREAADLLDKIPQDAEGNYIVEHDDALYHPDYPGVRGYLNDCSSRVAFWCSLSGTRAYVQHPPSECYLFEEAAEAAREAK